MRHLGKPLETAVYVATAFAVAVWAASSVSPAEARPEPKDEVVLEFSASDLLNAQLMTMGVIGVIPSYAVVGDKRGGIEQYRGRTEAFSYEELKHLLKLIGFSGDGLRTAWAVVMRESTGNPLAHNTDASTKDNSYGLFQINMFGTLEAYRQDKYNLPSNDVLFDPVLNAQIAFELSKGGTDFGDWNVGPNAYRGDGAPADVMRWIPEYPEE